MNRVDSRTPRIASATSSLSAAYCILRSMNGICISVPHRTNGFCYAKTSSRAAVHQDGGNGQRDQFHVGPHAPVHRVFDIEREHGFGVEAAAAAHLPKSGDAGLHLVALVVPIPEVLQLVRNRRPRTD